MLIHDRTVLLYLDKGITNEFMQENCVVYRVKGLGIESSLTSKELKDSNIAN